MSDWRDDPSWRLTGWDVEHFKSQPADRPTQAAELAQPPTWASEYHERRIVATWYRPTASLHP